MRGSTPRERVRRARPATSGATRWRTATSPRSADQVGAITLLELPLEVTLVAELEAAGVRGPAARDALRAILACIAGFLVDRVAAASTASPTSSEPARCGPSVDDRRVAPETLAALAEPSDLDDAVRAHARAVVDAVPTPGPPRRAR